MHKHKGSHESRSITLIALLSVALSGVPRVVMAEAARPTKPMTDVSAAEVAPAPAVAPVKLPANQTASSMERAKLIIQVAESRIIGSFATEAEEKSFQELIAANAAVGFIDDAAGFTEFWKQNKAEILGAPPLVGAKPLNWQMFLAQTYTSYKINKTNANVDPSGLMQWMDGVVSNPWVNWATVGTAVAVMGALNFMTGVLKGAVVAGPAAGAINAGINPIMTPVNQKLTILGNKYFGPAGMKLNSLFFDAKESSVVVEDKKAKEAIAGLRALIEGRSYEISHENWGSNMKSLHQYWNKLNFLWGLVPDAYKAGRDRVADLTIRSSRDFAQAATNSVNASEVQRQGAESILDRLILKGANPQAVEQVGQQLVQVIEEQTRIDREQPERSQENQPRIESGKAELVQLGATAEQAERFVENYRKVYVFQRQAATMLVGQVMHDAMYSDTIKGAESIYNEFFKNQSLTYLHGQLKEAVVEILQRLEFKIDIRIAQHAKANAPNEKTSDPVLDKVLKVNGSNVGSRSLGEPGSVVKGEARTASERAQESAARAGRR